MTNNNTSSHIHKVKELDIQHDNEHTRDFGDSKSVFEGYFRFNTNVLHINTNNKQIFINTLIAVIRYLNRIHH